MFSFKPVFFAALAMASTAAAAPTPEDVLARINELERKLAEHVDATSVGEERLRKLKKDKKDDSPASPDSPSVPSLDYKSRNICYSTDATITSFVACQNERDDYYVGCTSDRRVMTEEDVLAAVKELQDADRKLCSDDIDFLGWTTGELTSIGALDVGAVMIGEDESLMVELTATTIHTAGFVNYVEADDYYYGIAGTAATAGVYVTATLWEDCTSAADCVGKTQIMPEPAEMIPITVMGYANSTAGTFTDGANFMDHELVTNTSIATTNTVKLFFPDSALTDDMTYFMTLDFSAVSTAGAGCFPNDGTVAAAFANATLGPYIIDAEIIKDGNFGECGWLDPSTTGCGLFDEVSGSTDVDCSS